MTDESRSHSESPDDFSWPESRIRALLEEILETGSDPEQVSGGDHKLERLLRERLRRARDVEAQLEALFPSQDSGDDSTRRALLDDRRQDGRLPQIPGYEITSVIGTGGMGVVYRARQLQLDRWVAIKMVLLGAYASGDELRALLREARDVATLRHPNIVQVYDVGEHDGFPYFAMELLDGGDLARTLQGRPRPARDAADLIRVLAGAVHTAHLGGIVHRDLKPGNIFLCSDGTPKIGDFSLASRPGHDTTIMTHARQGGTPSYMSPEQAAGKSTATRPAVDIYALGAMLYELLTGRPPFKGESSTETRRQVIADEPVPPTRLNSRVPRDLQTICLKCLQKDPARRYGTAAELADDLRRFTSREPILARPVGPVERTVKWCRRRPSAALSVGVCLVAMAAAVAGGVWLQQVHEARRTAEFFRREQARTSIEAAFPPLSRFVASQQWMDATGLLRTAQAHLTDAASPELEHRLAAAEEHFEVAQELARIRQSFVAIGYSGSVHYPARDAYARVFARLGIGRDAGIHEAASVLRTSPLRDQLLVALDSAAYIEARYGDASELSRLLAVGRAVTPNQWQDRFRNQDTWADIAGLKLLVEDAKTAESAPPCHQMILIGLLLDRLGDNAGALDVLRESQLREPSDFSVNFWLARAHDTDDAQALQFLRAAAALNPTDALTWSEIGLRLLRTGRYEDAVGPLRKATSIQPDFAMAWANLFFSLVGCGRWEEAVAAERDARHAIPAFSLGDSEDILQMCLARAAVINQDWSVAADAYTRALKGRYVDSAALWYESAAASVLAGDMPAYQQICTTMLELQASAGMRKFLVGRACTIGMVPARDLVLAKDLATPELDLQADGHWSLIQRAAFLCRDGRDREAIPVLERSRQVSAHPAKLVLTWVWLARAHLSLGERDSSEAWHGVAADWLRQSDTKPDGIHLHDWLEAQILWHEVDAELAS